MKKLKNKGFTIIELLTVILILALIVAMVVPSYNAIIKKNKAKIYDSKKNMIILAAEKYATDENLSGINTISVNKLIEEGYIAGEKDEDGNYNIINDVNNENMRCYTITIDATSELPEAALNEKANCEFVESEIASEILQVTAFSGDTFDLDELDPTKYSVPLSKKWFNRDITVVARLVLPTLVNPGEDGYENYQTKLNYYNEFKYFGYLYDYPAPVTPGAPGYDKYQKIVAANNAVTANKDKIKVRWIGQTVAYSSGEYYSNAIGMLKVASGLETGEEAYNVIDARTNMQLLSSNGRSYKIDCKNCLYLTGSSFYQQIYTVEFINENGHILRKTFKVNIDKNPALAVASVNPNWEDGGVGCDSSNLDKCKKKVIITGSDQNGSGLFKIRLSGNAGLLDWLDHEDDNKYEVELGEGVYDVYTIDNAGNESSDPADTVTIDKIDKNPPVINSLSASPSVWTKEDVTLTGNVIDEESGLKEFIFTKDNTKPATMTNIPVITDKVQSVNQVIDNNAANEGTIDWYLHTKDAVGRYTGSTTTIKTKIDITKPSITFTYDETKTSGHNNYVTITATCTDALPAGKSSGVNNIVLTKSIGGTTSSNTVIGGAVTAAIDINTVAANQTVTASCTDNAGNVKTVASNSYTLYNVVATFKRNGATTIGGLVTDTLTDSCISFKSKACTLTSPTITRDTFSIVGWGDAAADTISEWDIGASKPLSADDSYYAITKATATIVFNANGGSGGTTKSCVIQNTATTCSITSPSSSAVTQTNYDFIGWGDTATDTTSDWNGGVAVSFSGNTSSTYYAIWEATIQTFTVHYHANGGSGTMNDQVITYGEAQNLSANTFTRAGYSFIGWTAYRDIDGKRLCAANPTHRTIDAWRSICWVYGYGDYYYYDGQSVSQMATSGTVTMTAIWLAYPAIIMNIGTSDISFYNASASQSKEAKDIDFQNQSFWNVCEYYLPTSKPSGATKLGYDSFGNRNDYIVKVYMPGADYYELTVYNDVGSSATEVFVGEDGTYHENSSQWQDTNGYWGWSNSRGHQITFTDVKMGLASTEDVSFKIRACLDGTYNGAASSCSTYSNSYSPRYYFWFERSSGSALSSNCS